MFFDFFKQPDINEGIKEFKASDGAVLLDVRSKEEYSNGHIPDSINIDVGQISKVKDVITDCNTPVYVYCLSGGRAGSAVSSMKSMGYTNVKNIGGINSYKGETER